MVFRLLLGHLGRKAVAAQARGSSQNGAEQQPATGDGVPNMLRDGLATYGHLNRADRASGGGIGFATIVKLAGWAGLIAVMAALVVKLRTIEQQLDPVAHGVAELRDELDQARTDIHREAAASRGEIQQLGSDAAGLRASLKESRATQGAVRDSLDSSKSSAASQEANLRDGVEQSRVLSTTTATLAASVSDVQRDVEASRTSLGSTLSADSTAAKGLGDALTQVTAQAGALRQTLASLDAQPAQAALHDVTTQAQALADSLGQAKLHADELDRLLAKRAAAERTAISAAPASPRAQAIAAAGSAGAPAAKPRPPGQTSDSPAVTSR